MSTHAVEPHYPTIAPFAIADVETVLGIVESTEDLAIEERLAVERLRLTLTAAQQAQARARSDHPSLDGLLGAEVDAGNVVAGPVHGPATHGAHVTEEDAAERIRLVAGNLRARVLAAIVEAGPAGLTDTEVEAKLGLRRPTGGNRRGELVKLGLVAKRLDEGGATIKRTVAGHGPAACWAATDRAIPALRELGYDVVEDLIGWSAPTVTAPGPELDIVR
jgi:hypothetical protein